MQTSSIIIIIIYNHQLLIHFLGPLLSLENEGQGPKVQASNDDLVFLVTSPYPGHQESPPHQKERCSNGNKLFQHLSGNDLISPSCLKDSFASYEICGQTVSFSILNISTHCLLASKVSNKKSVKNLIWNPLYVMSYFLTTLKILFVFRQFNYNVSQCGFP